MDVTYKLFRREDIGKLYKAFVAAFSEYYVNFNPSVSQFKDRIFKKLNVHPEISGLVWEEDDVVGFILHTMSDYAGKKTAYNGGTGVIPSRRNRKLMRTLYEKLIPEIQAQQAERILLEVVTKNISGIKLYESLGFQFTRTFHCFKSYQTYRPDHSFRIENSPVIKDQYEEFWDFRPAFLDDSPQLKHNLLKEFVLEAYIEDKLVGYIIFQPQIGRISQLAVHKEHRGENIGRELMAYAQAKSIVKTLTIMNIPEGEHQMISRLQELGFCNEVDQYEMELII